MIPVIFRFVYSFSFPDSLSTKYFWLLACQEASYKDVYQHDKLISGWLTAFYFWGKKGKPILDMPSACTGRRKRFTLDDVEYPIILRQDIPISTCSVSVIVHDAPNMSKDTMTIFAGSIGMFTQSKGRAQAMKPYSGWWMVHDLDKFILPEKGAEPQEADSPPAED